MFIVCVPNVIQFKVPTFSISHSLGILLVSLVVSITSINM